MGSNPLVSVITIFFNREKYLEEAIESVLVQTYSNWELLLVDDGSTDKSTGIARHYAQQHSGKIHYLTYPNHQNSGMSAARNLGLRYAKGVYLTFLDSDDVYLPNKLERQVAVLEAMPEVGMTYGKFQMWYSWTGKPEDLTRDYIQGLDVPTNTLFIPPNLLALFIKNKGMGPANCSTLIRREVVELVGGFEEVFRELYEDGVFWAKIYLRTSVFTLDEWYERYRQHPESSSAIALKTGKVHLSKANPAHLTFMKWLELYLTEQKVKDSSVWQAFHKAMWPYRHPRLYLMLSFLKTIAKKALSKRFQHWLRRLVKKPNS